MEEINKMDGRRARRENREDERSANERPRIAFGTGSQFNYSETVLSDKRYQFGWVPYIVANEQVTIPYDNAIRDGWEPASEAEYPSLKRTYKDPFGRSRDDGDDFIRRGGLIAMKRDMNIGNAEKEHWAKENQQQNQMISHKRMHDPSQAYFLENQRTHSTRPDDSF